MATFIIFLSGLCNIILGSLVLSKKPRDKAARLFFLFSISASLWLFPSVLWRLSHVYLWAKIGYATGTIFAVSGLIWAHALCEIKRPLYYSVIYAFAFALFVTALFDNTIILRYSGTALTEAFQKGAFFDLYSIFLAGIIALILFRLWQGYYRQTGLKKIQVKYIGISTLCFGGWVMLVDLVIPTVFNRFDYTIFDTPSSTILIATTAYVTLKYRLLDTQILIRKGFIYGAIALFAYGVFHLVAWIFLQVFGSLWSLPALLVGFFVAVAFALMLPFVERFFIYVANNFLYANIYNAQDTFQRLLNNIVSIIDVDELSSMIVAAISSTFKVSNSMVVITREQFRVAAGYGFAKKDITLCKALVSLVPRLKSVMDYDELEYCVKKERGERDAHFFDAFNSFFHNTNAKLVVPLQSKARNLGFIVVGAKQADKMFTREDIALLDTLGKQAAIAIDNALLYQALQKKNKRLYQLLNTQKEFLDIASHELRTPISIIRSASSILMQHGEDVLNQDDAIAMMHSASVRMNATVDSLLIASKVDTAEFLIVKQSMGDIHVRSLVERVIGILSLQARQCGVEVTLDIDGSLNMRAHEKYMEIVLTNLIGNAIKYSGRTAGGKVAIRAEKKHKRVKIFIQDNGIGIPHGETERLFDKFVRASNAKRMVPEGTGLGLYIVRRIVEAHGGKYGFESTEGRGSLFWVEFLAKT